MLPLLLLRWALLVATSWGAILPFVYTGEELNVSSVEITPVSTDSARYLVTVTATNLHYPIDDVSRGYRATLRSSFFASSSSLPEDNALPLCATIEGGCPIMANETFVFSFNITSKQAIKQAYSGFLHCTLAESRRFLGTIDVQITPCLSPSVVYCLCVLAPALCIIVAIIKYLLVIWLDPETVSTWDPLHIRASAANELATLGSARHVIQYFQFICFMVTLDVEYPAYFPGAFAKLTWIIGIFPNNLLSGNPAEPSAVDGLIVPRGSSQLEAIMYFANLSGVEDLWPAAALAILGFLVFVFIGSLLLKLTSKYRIWHAAANTLHYTHMIIGLPALFVLFTSFIYYAKTNISTPTFYIPSGPNSHVLSKTLPYSFALADSFYYTNNNAGIIFSMAFTLFAMVCAAVYLGYVMFQARKRDYLSKKIMIMCGRYYTANGSDMFYFFFDVFLVILQAVIFSFLSNRPIAQCTLYLICQLSVLATASGMRRHELSYVGFVLVLIPRFLQIVICCLAFPLLSAVVKTYDSTIPMDHIAHAMFCLHTAITLLYLMLNFACICITVWRHFKLKEPNLRPVNRVGVVHGPQPTLPPNFYFRTPRFQPDVVDEFGKEDYDDSTTTDYLTREVDFVYGINRFNLDKVENAPPPKFVEKMFRPNPGFEVIRDTDPQRNSSGSQVPMLEPKYPTPIAIRQREAQDDNFTWFGFKRKRKQPTSTFEVLRPAPSHPLPSASPPDSLSES